MIHTVGDVIYAHNAGLDLFKLVVQYLKDWTVYANGAYDITFKPSEVINCRFHGISGTPEKPTIKVSACSRVDYVSYDVFVEDDVADYEGYRMPGHYEPSGYEDRAYREISIPIELLLDTREQRIKKMGDMMIAWKQEQEQKKKQESIRRLEEELTRLKTT